MAAPLVPTVPNTPLLPTYNHDDDKGRPQLPNGPCNFTNLSVGGNAPRCGCRRFWEQSASSSMAAEVGGSGPRAGWCMCEHHACFHDHDPMAASRLPSAAESVGRVSLSLQRSILSSQEPPGLERFQAGHREGDRRTGDEALPDTLQWNQYVHSGSHAAHLPPIPSQCLMPSRSSSVTASIQARYARPFGGLGLQTLSHIPTPSNQGPGLVSVDKGPQLEEKSRIMRQYEDSAGHVYMQSLTEEATPRSRCSPEYDEAAVFDSNVRGIKASLDKLADERAIKADEYSVAFRSNQDEKTFFKKSQDTQAAPVGSYPDSEDEENHRLLPKIRSIVQHVSDYPITMKNHESRLDLLENASFCNPGLEDLQERHENLDTRVGELETRVNDIERSQNDASSIGSRHNLEESMESRASHTSSGPDRAELNSTIELLKAQIAELQSSALPSYRHPWEVEVVFLPYGAQLKGIWATQQVMTQRSRTNSLRAEDWTQTQQNSMASAQALLAAQDHLGTWENVAMGGDDQQEWLMAKACGLHSIVDERLRSRGLVKSIQIKGPDARDFQAAMMGAFGDLPAWLAGISPDGKLPPIHAAFDKYLGLQASWIPLRKIHKDSCLKFLSPSEMITPSLWTVTWLQSSVAMRAANKTRRLYVTQRDSYIQHQGDGIVDWTWQMLRELPRVYPNTQSSMEVPEADADEICWEFDERLDAAPDLQSSFLSQHSSLSIRSVRQDEEEEFNSPSDHFSSAAVSEAPSPILNAIAVMRPISPLKERHPFRPVHGRTTSMPLLAPVESTPPPPQGQGLSKRRIASFEHETQSSPIKKTYGSHLKRRRISRSPSRPCDTPRWSVGPPSPYAFDPMERKRGTTPFAYATPHSNAPYMEPSSRAGKRYDNDDQGSTTDEAYQNGDYHASMYDSDSESGAGDDQPPDEEWEGVQDETTDYESRQGSQGRSLPHHLYHGHYAMERHDEDAGEGEGEENDEVSDISSQPSEYPSTQPPPPNIFVTSKGSTFQIHVDEEMFDHGD
ncbi:hypothetical protein PVAG01_03360 [Phlyctema vagabunda]|uniref:Uncharacterized protein n=1 Tax=Phlyctema vagabunda TaxID=108571 RepID=A0ABR4PL90_9HELO